MTKVKDSQCERLLNHMRNGQAVDGITAWQVLGIYRLASRIYDLRESGWQVDDRWIKGRNQFGERVRWKIYFIERENR